MIIVTLILALALATLAVIVALQNPTEIVNLKLFGFEWTDSATIVLIVTYAAGILTGAVLLLPGSIANRTKLMVARRKLGSIAKTADKEKEAGR